MKLIFNSTAKYLSEDLTKHFIILLKSHGVKPKEKIINQFKEKMFLSLGGKNKSIKKK